MPPALPDADPRVVLRPPQSAFSPPLGNSAVSPNATSSNAGGDVSSGSTGGNNNNQEEIDDPRQMMGNNSLCYNDENAPPANIGAAARLQGAPSGVARARGPEFDSDESSSDSSMLDGSGNGSGNGSGSSGRGIAGRDRRSVVGEGKAEMKDNGADRLAVEESWRRRIMVGSALDVLDTVGKWSEAEVLLVDPVAHRVYVTYTFWADRWDEWISLSSPRLAPPGSSTYQEGGDLRVNHRVEVHDGLTDRWYEAEVIEEATDAVQVHYPRRANSALMGPAADEWIERDSPRVRPYGRQKEIFRKKRNRRMATLLPGQPGHEGEEQQHRRKIVPLSERYAHYLSALAKHGHDIVPVEGDGNCLFRSVSHQIYGDDKYHALVRAKCMDYMESEREYFEPYVEGSMEDFMRYLELKRQNAVWGDDPEVQALCEMYDRRAEIWAYDAVEGAKMLRTFHEAGGSGGGSGSGGSGSGQYARAAPVMRLSYYGGGHYDSIVSLSRRQPLAWVRQPPGMIEDAAILRSRARLAATPAPGRGMEEAKLRSDEEATERAALDLALQASRNEFDRQWQADDLEGALKASMEHIAEQEAASVAAAAQDSELISLQEQMLRSAQAQSENEMLRRALEASVGASSSSAGNSGKPSAGAAAAAAGGAASSPYSAGGDVAAAESAAAAAAAAALPAIADADDLDAAIRASLVGIGGSSGGGSGGGGSGSNAAVPGNVDEELQQALRLSAALAEQPLRGGEPEEDPELAAALAMSLADHGGGGGGGIGGVGGLAAAAFAGGATMGAHFYEDEELSQAIEASLMRH